jgi:hypothetical protein
MLHNSSIPKLHWDPPATERAVVGGKQLLTDLMAAVGQDHIVLAKETSNHIPFGDGAEVNAMMPTDTFCSSYAADGNMTYDPQQVCGGPSWMCCPWVSSRRRNQRLSTSLSSLALHILNPLPQPFIPPLFTPLHPPTSAKWTLWQSKRGRGLRS